MNKYLNTRVLTTNLALFFCIIVYGQDVPPSANPAYGNDSASRINCAAELSTLSEYMKISMFEYALPAWRNVFANCPASSKNIYISGVKIFRKLIEDSRDPALKSAYFDTLMLNYDLRIKYFGEEGYVLGRKGIDIIRYNDKDYEDAYYAFLTSSNLSGSETDLNVIVGLVQTGLVMMKADKISSSDFLNNYLMCTGLLSEIKSKGGSASGIKRVKESMDKVMAVSGIQDCEVIESVFSDKIQTADPDPALLNIASGLLSSAGCDNSAFYAWITEKLMDISPDAGKAYELARFYIRNENFVKAAGYLDKAIAAESKPEQKAVYQYQLSLVLSTKLGRFSEARDAALQAIKNKPGWADPYFVIANAYITGIDACASEDFERKAVYWLAVDYCKKAKEADPESDMKAGELISQYRSNFPSVEETFFRSLKEGDTYRIGCWINESTTVKAR